MLCSSFAFAEARRSPQLYAIKIVAVFCLFLTVGVFISSPEWSHSVTRLIPTHPAINPVTLHIHPQDYNPSEGDPPPETEDDVLKPAEDPPEPVKEVPKPAEELPKAVAKSHLRVLCDNTTWTEGLWLSCHSKCGTNEESICGGLNNARNRLQSCVRLAIDAGAGLVIPTMANRNEKTLKPHDGATEICASDLWSSGELAETLKEQCPQLNLRFCGNTTGLGPKISSRATRHFNSPPHTVGTFRKTVEDDLKNSSITDISASNPVRIDMWDGMFSWNYSASNELETVRKDLFKALPYNADILKLGGQIFDLINKYAPFVGIHLRGEGDWPHFFGTKEQQMGAYEVDLAILRESSSAQIHNLYVSCGDQRAIQIFREKMAPLNYTVHDKWTLLAESPDLLAKMENLTFDQKGIVEYKTLTAADYFYGVGLSSMSLLVAFARTVDEKEDYWSHFIHDNSIRIKPLDREYPISPIMKGNEKTRLYMLSGPDIMDRYP